jgi:hypothetical protein
MLRSLFGFDWRKSHAHLLLLSNFLHPKTVDDFKDSDSWKAVLGESPEHAIKRFTDEEMLAQANLNAQLDYKFKTTELKSMLKQRGLTVSGRKEDLISRLVQSDLEAMKIAVAGLLILICTERGQKIADQYLSAEKAKQIKLEEYVLEYLKQCKFKEASLAVATYESEQVFPRGGVGIDWKNYNPTNDIERLKLIYGSSPKIFSRLSYDHLAILRHATAMVYLLGTNQSKKWLPPDFETGLVIDNDSALRMFSFYVSHQVTLGNYRQGGVEYVEILTAQDSCQACKEISGKKYKLNYVLELPYEHCTHKAGCKCVFLPVVDLL